jgi:hypothetical protein
MNKALTPQSRAGVHILSLPRTNHVLHDTAWDARGCSNRSASIFAIAAGTLTGGKRSALQSQDRPNGRLRGEVTLDNATLTPLRLA